MFNHRMEEKFPRIVCRLLMSQTLISPGTSYINEHSFNIFPIFIYTTPPVI